MFGWIDNYIMGIFGNADRVTFFHQVAVRCDIFATCAAWIFRRIIGHLLSGTLPIHLRHFVAWAEVFVRIAVAIETPAHTQWLVLVHAGHLVDPTVTTGASNACCNVYAVIKERVIREHVHTHPRNRLACLIALAHEFELGAFGEDLGMASHTDRRRRHSGVRSFFDGRMAITAIHPKFARVQFMTERHGLDGGIPHVRKLGRKPVPYAKGCKCAPCRYKSKQH